MQGTGFDLPGEAEDAQGNGADYGGPGSFAPASFPNFSRTFASVLAER